MKNNIKFYEHGKEISFYKEGWSQVAHIDNIPQIVEQVKSSSWCDKNGYLYSNMYKKYLHRLVMENFIGQDTLEEYTKLKYVVDHINNSEPYNCCIDNLHLLPANVNKAKGFTVDQDIEKVRLLAGIGFYHLDNEEYQMAIGYNSPTVVRIDDQWVDVSVIYINFDGFDKCFIAAQTILLALKNGENINLNHLQALKWTYKPVVKLTLTEEEKKQGGCCFIRGDKVYIAINNDISKGPISIIHKPAKQE